MFQHIFLSYSRHQTNLTKDQVQFEYNSTKKTININDIQQIESQVKDKKYTNH